LEASSKRVEREEHGAQKMPPLAHFRQCYGILNMRKMGRMKKCRPTCLRSKSENCTRQYKLSQVEENFDIDLDIKMPTPSLASGELET
jgi:hypothetical protein